jgi:hypothetical protein
MAVNVGLMLLTEFCAGELFPLSGEKQEKHFLRRLKWIIVIVGLALQIDLTRSSEQEQKLSNYYSPKKC